MISFIGQHLSLIWQRLENAAQKRNVSLKVWFPLWVVGSAIWYWGLWILVTHDFFLGLAIMAGSYFLDYGYVFVVGNPDRKMFVLVAVAGSVGVVSLAQRVGIVYATIVVVTVGSVIALARVIHKQGKE